MRKVAGYSFKIDCDDEGSRDEVYLGVMVLIDEWLAAKGQIDGDDFLMPNGAKARIKRQETIGSTGHSSALGLMQKSVDAIFNTIIKVAAFECSVFVYCEIQVAGHPGYVGPIRFDARCPSVIRNILDKYDGWMASNTPITTTPINLSGYSDGLNLIEILKHEQRNLPVIISSSQDLDEFNEEFEVKLAADVCGLAIVFSIDAEVAWCLTKEMGREWSCFNGAVRVYWPGIKENSKPKVHPLWSRSAILASAESSVKASIKFRRQLRHRIMDISAHAFIQPKVFSTIQEESRTVAASKAKSNAAQSGEWNDYIEEVSNENDRLREECAIKDQEIDDLRAQVLSLQQQVEWRDWSGSESDLPPSNDISFDAPVETISQAVEQAKQKHGDFLVFGGDVEAGISGLAPDAGPPSKVALYFEKLADLAKLRKSGGLKGSALDWLKQNGVIATGETPLVMKSPSERKKRTWNDGAEDRVFEFHLKPADAVSPDRCVRIYYDYDADFGRNIIGWVGQHID